MPTHSVAPEDAPFGVLFIDRERHQTPVPGGGNDDGERLERGVHLYFQALRGNAMTEPQGNVPRNDADSRCAAYENRCHADTRAVADCDRRGSERSGGEVRRELPAQHASACRLAQAAIVNHPGAASLVQYPSAMCGRPAARKVARRNPGKAAEV